MHHISLSLSLLVSSLHFFSSLVLTLPHPSLLSPLSQNTNKPPPPSLPPSFLPSQVFIPTQAHILPINFLCFSSLSSSPGMTHSLHPLFLFFISSLHPVALSGKFLFGERPRLLSLLPPSSLIPHPPLFFSWLLNLKQYFYCCQQNVTSAAVHRRITSFYISFIFINTHLLKWSHQIFHPVTSSVTKCINVWLWYLKLKAIKLICNYFDHQLICLCHF